MTERLCRLCLGGESGDRDACHSSGLLCPECGYWRVDPDRQALRARAAREAIATWREARRHRAHGLTEGLLDRARLAVEALDHGPERERLAAELLDRHEGPPPR